MYPGEGPGESVGEAMLMLGGRGDSALLEGVPFTSECLPLTFGITVILFVRLPNIGDRTELKVGDATLAVDEGDAKLVVSTTADFFGLGGLSFTLSRPEKG